MAKKNLTIRRGTTPYLTATIKDNIDLSNITTAWLTIAQDNIIVLDKKTEDLTISGNKVFIRLSQEDTLSLKSGVSSYIQLRLLTDGELAYASQCDFVSVERIIKDGVIE
jgi:hypothetical protein